MTDTGKAQPVTSSTTPTSASVPTTAKVSATSTIAKLDRYTVVQGDTLAKIAAKAEVYGDENLWPLLYQSNAAQIKNGMLIIPGQVLTINREHSEADLKALKVGAKTRPQRPIRSARSESEAMVEAGAPLPVPSVSPYISQVKAKQDYLEEGRQAYLTGDMFRTLYCYNTYLANYPKDADAWGEIGNIYTSQGWSYEAARSYYNAAKLLIEQGHASDASELIPVIQSGNPELADKLKKRLTELQQKMD